ncbi:hypothetical protein [Velocimicrobium porci]|uniref:Uncharacterized protein n=1 Tax=Velocimicrobium porci TaxID=2606634 RepID=A0A6L5XWI6_9FIRM|nr:hypothetical protein [Velocimicrobium porci]MSS63186.1 hypothetical protein [Velocimicrobium porci]
MTGYEKLVLMIRDSAKKQNNGLLQGVMTSSSSCKIGEQEYLQDDLVIPVEYKKKICSRVLIVDGEDRSTYIEPLKKGDVVFLYPITDTEFLIVGRE